MPGKPMLRVAFIALAALLSLAACTPWWGAPPAAPPAEPTTAPPPPQAEAQGPTAAAPEPTPTPAEQPVPAAERLQRGKALQEDGEYEAAGAVYRSLLTPDVPAAEQREALLRLGQADLQAGAYQAAAESLRRFLATYQQDEQAATASFWLGEALAGQGDGQGALAAYHQYLEGRPLLQSYVQERIGAALAKAGDQAGAVDAYRAAADAEPQASGKAGLLESLATSQRALERYDQAVATYDEILGFAKNASYRAQIMYEAGAAWEEAGQPAQAAARWNELVAGYPESTYAAQALPRLDAWGLATVDTVTRGRVLYNGQQYAAAQAALQRYIKVDKDHEGAAHYYAALCYSAQGQRKEALRELDSLIRTHAQSAYVPAGWYQKGEILALMGSVDQAAAAFQQVAAGYPEHARAIQALWRVAQVYDSAGRTWDASAAYLRAASTYPAASYAPDARFRAGFTHYLKGALEAASKVWTEVLPQEPGPEMRARLLLWLGKVAQRLNDPERAREKWSVAVASSPDGFWGLRARDLMEGRSFGGQAPAGAYDPARYAMRGDQAAAEAWLVGWAGAPPEGQALRDLPGALTELEAFKRGEELLALGDMASATAELRQVQTAAKGDARGLYALSLYCHDHGLYQLSATAAERAVGLAPAAARQQTPRFLEELIYPTYYADLVLPEAQPTNTDPLLFFALVRQESIFDRDATSYSDARGLAQVIPSTGKYIADQLGDSSYASERLWRAAVSVRYGMWYLSRALVMFEDDALMALVAYNAGPGNAAAWAKLAYGDDDVYFERVSEQQPRSYMIRIYEHRAHYEKLYGASP